MEKCYSSNFPEFEWKVALKSSSERTHMHCSFSGLIDIVLGGPVYDKACCCIPKDTLEFSELKENVIEDMSSQTNTMLTEFASQL